jgi:alpha-1,6-mannosyltransferase
VCAGEWLATNLRDHGCARVACVPFGIRHEDFSPGHRDEALRAELLDAMGVARGGALLAVVGRLAIEKRVGKVFQALASLRTEHPLGVLVLGDGPERTKLEGLARRLDLPVAFQGFVTERSRYAQLLASADALVHGCPCETFGFAVAEALASGVPTVVPDGGGASEFVEAACGERYAAEGTSVDIAVATQRLLRRPRNPLSEAAFRASRRVGRADAHFDALFALYRARLAG